MKCKIHHTRRIRLPKCYSSSASHARSHYIDHNLAALKQARRNHNLANQRSLDVALHSAFKSEPSKHMRSDAKSNLIVDSRRNYTLGQTAVKLQGEADVWTSTKRQAAPTSKKQNNLQWRRPSGTAPRSQPSTHHRVVMCIALGTHTCTARVVCSPWPRPQRPSLASFLRSRSIERRVDRASSLLWHPSWSQYPCHRTKI